MWRSQVKTKYLEQRAGAKFQESVKVVQYFNFMENGYDVVPFSYIWVNIYCFRVSFIYLYVVI